MKNYNYYPQTVKVKVNETVRIYLDSSVSGCYRAFTIRDLGVSKYISTPNDYVEFTPIKTGTFRFACTMGMGTGTLIVE
jgi:plastocyanin domain-containing protein